MRTALIGAVDSTRVALATMADAGHPPAALLTLPPTRAARHSDYVDLEPLARSLGVRVVHAPDVNGDDALAALAALEPDHVFVIGWSQICRAPLLAACGRGAIGYHPAPLPRLRGRGVIPWTIVLGERESGSTLFWLDEGMDSGDVLDQACFPVAPDETAASLYAKHLVALETMLRRSLDRLARGDAPRTPQDHDRATYCARRTPADGFIDWRRSADEVWTLIRASGAPYPGAFTFRGGERLVVWSAERVHDRRYHGVPGQVQAVDARGALVQCGDGDHVLLRDVQLGAGSGGASALKVHERLGPDVVALWERVMREPRN